MIHSMLNAGTLTFKEFAMREPLPLATIHDAVLQFLRGRDDAVVFGAQAVNAYVDEPRMSQDIDLVSTRANELAEELREYLSERFHIAVRVRVIGAGAECRCAGAVGVGESAGDGPYKNVGDGAGGRPLRFPDGCA